MLAIHERDFGLTVETVFLIVGVIDEACIVSKTSRINNIIFIEVE